VHRALVITFLLLAGCATELPHDLTAAARQSLLLPRKPVRQLGAVSRLPTGLRIAAYQVEGRRDVVVRLALQVGEAYQPSERPGLAALAASVARSARLGPGGTRLEERLYAAGTVFLVEELPDELSVEVRCRPAQLAEVVGLLAPLVDGLGTAVSEDDVAEARQLLARFAATDLFRTWSDRSRVVARSLAGTRYAAAPITPEALAAIGADEVRGFLRAYYVPRRAVLVVTGGDDAETLYRTVGRALPARLVGAPEQVVDPDPVAAVAGLAARPAGSVEEVKVPKGQATLWLGWPLPGADAGAEVAARSAAALVEQGLVASLRSPARGLHVQAANVEAHAWDAAGVLLVHVTLDPAADAEAVRAAAAEWASNLLGPGGAWSRPLAVSQDDIYQAVAAGFVEGEARTLRVTGRPNALARFEAEAASLSRVWEAYLRRWIAPGPSAAVLFRPERTTGNGLDPRAGQAEGFSFGPFGPFDPFGATSPGAGDLVRLVEPPKLAAAHREPLPGGAELVVLPRPGAPYVWGRLMLPGGGANAGQEPAASQALRGAEADLRIRGGCSTTAGGTVVSSMARMDDMQASVRLPRLVEALSCWSRAGADQASGASRLTAGRATIVGAARAVATGRSAAELEALEASETPRTYLRRTLRPEGARVILVGDVTPSPQLSAWARQGLSAWTGAPAGGAGQVEVGAPATPIPTPPTPPPAPRPPTPWPSGRRVVVLDSPGAASAEAYVFLRAPAELARSIAAERLMDFLLLKRTLQVAAASKVAGLAFPAIVDDTRQLVLVVSGEADRVPEALDQLLAEVGRLAGEGPSPAETDAARWQVGRVAAFEFDSPTEALEGLSLIAARGLPSDGLEHLGADLAALGPAQVRDTVRSLALGKEAILLNGEVARLGPALSKRGLGWEPWPATSAVPAPAPAAR